MWTEIKELMASAVDLPLVKPNWRPLRLEAISQVAADPVTDDPLEGFGEYRHYTGLMGLYDLALDGSASLFFLIATISACFQESGKEEERREALTISRKIEEITRQDLRIIFAVKLSIPGALEGEHFQSAIFRSSREQRAGG